MRTTLARRIVLAAALAGCAASPEALPEASAPSSRSEGCVVRVSPPADSPLLREALSWPRAEPPPEALRDCEAVFLGGDRLVCDGYEWVLFVNRRTGECWLMIVGGVAGVAEYRGPGRIAAPPAPPPDPAPGT